MISVDSAPEIIAAGEQKAAEIENDIMEGFEGHVPRGDYFDTDFNGTRGLERQQPDL